MKSDPTMYVCRADDECIYKKVTGRTNNFMLCTECYKSEVDLDVGSKSKESSGANAFLFKKVKWTLERIS